MDIAELKRRFRSVFCALPRCQGKTVPMLNHVSVCGAMQYRRYPALGSLPEFLLSNPLDIACPIG